MSWTDERVALLKKLWEKGLSASQIAAELGSVTRNAVIGKAHRMGLASRPSPLKTETQKPKAAKKKAPEKKVVKERITLLQLTDRMCKWPIGHPGEPDFHFCGKKAESGVPYCADHCAQAYQTQTARRDRRAVRVRPLGPPRKGVVLSPHPPRFRSAPSPQGEGFIPSP